MPATSGRHFLQIPGPTNVPDRVLRAIDAPTIDHRSIEFAKLALGLLQDLRTIFKTAGPVVIYPASGTGAWEAALVNTLDPGGKVLMYQTGHFASLWYELAKKYRLDPVLIPGDWRRGVEPEKISTLLSDDTTHEIKAVCVVHNETSTGVTSNIPAVRKAMDEANHPALLMVDTISSLASIDYRHDEWGVDVTVAGSQKGLMLPPGLSFNAVSEKALRASENASLPRSFWDWQAMLNANENGFFPYTPATNLLFGLRAAIDMLLEEGLDNVFERHARLANATRTAVNAWGLENLCINSAEYSNTLTAVMMPVGHSADTFRQTVLEEFNMSLGSGLGKVTDKIFRIGHLGDFNELMLMGTLAGVEMGLQLSGVPHQSGGVAAAMEALTNSARTNTVKSTSTA